MTHLSQETLWLVVILLAAAVACWRGTLSAKSRPDTLRLLRELEGRTDSLLKRMQLFEGQIEVLHQRVSWVRREQYVASTQPEVALATAELGVQEAAQ
jgi:hypothetical protein